MDDREPFPLATLQDLDLELFHRVYLPAALPAEILEQNQRTDEAQLASLRFVSLDGGAWPTTLVLLVIGRDALRYLPGAYIQFLRIDGVSLADPIRDREEIGCAYTGSTIGSKF
jgi:ATP-dependent DNA helicase RecG